MTSPGRRGKFRVELDPHEPRVRRQLHDFREVLRWGPRTDPIAMGLELGRVMVVDLITVAVSLVDLRAVDPRGKSAGLDRTTLATQTHGAAQIRALITLFDLAVPIEPFGDQRDNRVRCLGVELGAVCVL